MPSNYITFKTATESFSYFHWIINIWLQLALTITWSLATKSPEIKIPRISRTNMIGEKIIILEMPSFASKNKMKEGIEIK